MEVQNTNASAKKEATEEISLKEYFAKVKAEKITEQDIVEAMLPLLDEYFFGEFQYEDGAITACFLSGQKFRINVNEIK